MNTYNCKKLKICVIGLGYVGLPLLVELSKFHNVSGFDIDKLKLDELRKGFDRTGELDDSGIKALNTVTLIDNLDVVDADVYIVTVPTPVNENKEPDLSPLISASEFVASVLKDGDLVIFESTVFPGATEEVCKPILERTGLKLNENFYIGYIPERVVPGKGNKGLSEITKIISISDNTKMAMIRDVYLGITKNNMSEANCIRVAESAKIFENIQRDVNIALVNEFAMICDSLNISITEVLSACATKWNFLKFYPGLVGGHCIGVDPYYLIDKCSKHNIPSNLISTAREVNEQAVNRYVEKLNNKVTLNKKKSILIIGYTFKENCSDTRNTKVKDLYYKLSDLCSQVSVLDPYATISSEDDNVSFVDSIDNYDYYVIAVWHDGFREKLLPSLRKISLQGRKNIFAFRDHEELDFCDII